MFKTPITATPLTTDTANGYFQNIAASNVFQSDVSFIATLRALVAPRIKDGERITLKFSNTNYTSDNIASVPVDKAVAAITSNIGLNNPGMFVVHNFNNPDQDSNMANMRAIDARFTALYEGYHKLDSMTDFFRKSFPVMCFINPSIKSVVIFLERLDMKKLHYLQCSILAALPWYFNPSDGVSEAEMELICSLRERSPDKYIECLNKIASQYDFRSARIRQLLSGFETRFERMECEKVQNEISNVDNEITRLNNSIGSYLSKRNDYCIKLMGLEAKIAQGGEDSEIMEYILCNNRVSLDEVTNTDMYFTVGDYLSYFDKEIVERVLNNRRSFIYTNGNGREYSRIAPDRMAKLIRAIFIDETIRMRFCAAYRFALNGNVSPMGHHTFGYEYNTYMPNPHINEYNCMGNYLKTINQLLLNHNYIGAIEQCIASCKSLNWGDSTVMSSFIGSMYGSGVGNNCCIELPDGSVVKPIKAIEWLEQQEARNGQEQTEEAHNE